MSQSIPTASPTLPPAGVAEDPVIKAKKDRIACQSVAYAVGDEK